MKDNWQNKEFAQVWDSETATLNPTRAQQLDILTSILLDGYRPGSYILDIGSGSGQVEEMILKRNPSIKIVGVDSARPMIEMAIERLKPYGNNFQVIEKDITQLEVSDLPQGSYGHVFSCQVTHELPNEEKEKLFKKAYQILQSDGSILIMDRIKVD